MYTDTSGKSPTKEVTFTITSVPSAGTVFGNEYSLNASNTNETSFTNLRKLQQLK